MPRARRRHYLYPRPRRRHNPPSPARHPTPGLIGLPQEATWSTVARSSNRPVRWPRPRWFFPRCRPPARYKIGLQLFTVNRDMNRDPIASLERVKQMGYEEVETYGLDPAALTYYRLPGQGVRAAAAGSQPADAERTLRPAAVPERQRRRPEPLCRSVRRRGAHPRAALHRLALSRAEELFMLDSSSSPRLVEHHRRAAGQEWPPGRVSQRGRRVHRPERRSRRMTSSCARPTRPSSRCRSISTGTPTTLTIFRRTPCSRAPRDAS